MPKPVLSDSLFNADDVATAVLAEANLQVTNNDLGVTNISADFTLNSAVWSQNQGLKAYHFNGFVFFNTRVRASSTPSGGTTIYTISSDYTPDAEYSTPAVGLNADSAGQVQFRSDGTIKMWDPVNSGASFFDLCFSGWYRI